MKAVKFATQLDANVARDLRRFAEHTDRSISRIVSEAVAEYIARYQVRPVVRQAMDNVLERHADLLARLAK
jgi:predicted transcriptional regulator